MTMGLFGYITPEAFVSLNDNKAGRRILVWDASREAWELARPPISRPDNPMVLYYVDSRYYTYVPELDKMFSIHYSIYTTRCDVRDMVLDHQLTFHDAFKILLL